MSKKATEFQRKAMSRMYRGKEIFKPLNTGWIDKNVACVREWVANIFFYCKDNAVIMIDAGYNYDRLVEKMGWESTHSRFSTFLSPTRTPTMWARWKRTAPDCSKTQRCTSGKLKTVI